MVKKEPSDQIVFAVPVSAGKLCAHFGYCDRFAFIETHSGRIKCQSMHNPPPHEPGILPKWLHEQGANTVLVEGMGTQAQELFNQNGINAITGVPMGSPGSLVNQYFPTPW
jgi:predicted Fe-Mo cluster-binding NifX family protein